MEPPYPCVVCGVPCALSEECVSAFCSLCEIQECTLNFIPDIEISESSDGKSEAETEGEPKSVLLAFAGDVSTDTVSSACSFLGTLLDPYMSFFIQLMIIVTTQYHGSCHESIILSNNNAYDALKKQHVLFEVEEVKYGLSTAMEVKFQNLLYGEAFLSRAPGWKSFQLRPHEVDCSTVMALCHKYPMLKVYMMITERRGWLLQMERYFPYATKPFQVETYPTLGYTHWQSWTYVRELNAHVDEDGIRIPEDEVEGTLIEWRVTDKLTVRWEPVPANRSRCQLRQDNEILMAKAMLQNHYHKWKIAALEAENAVLKEQISKIGAEDAAMKE